ncbi:MAG TPA: hypothetical protein VI756_03500 [Blastocatellia bacterium]
MEYFNPETDVRLDLTMLAPDEKQFYRQALQRFQENAAWGAFDDFAFGMRSPIYRRKASHLDVLKSPLYLALKDMSIQLGVRQGLIKRTKKAGRKAIA